MSLDDKLASLANLSQKDKGVAYCDLLKQLASATPPSSNDIAKVVTNALSQDHVGPVVGRQVLGELVKLVEEKPLSEQNDVTKDVIQISLDTIQRSVSYHEQVRVVEVIDSDHPLTTSQGQQPTPQTR